MPFYRVMIEGTGFSHPDHFEGRPYGFFTTCYVQAVSARVAEIKAVAKVRAEYVRKSGMPNLDPMPQLHREEVAKINAMPLPRLRRIGFTIYPPDDSDDW